MHSRLGSRSALGLTHADAGLAAAISKVARTDGLRAERHASTRLEVAIDALDIDAIRRFWAAALGYGEEPPFVEGDIGGAR